MKWKISLMVLCAAAAAAVACEKGIQTQPWRSVVIGGGANGAPRLTPPVPNSPADATQLNTLRPTLTVQNGTSNQTGTRTYDFEISDRSDFSGLPSASGAVTSLLQTGVAEGANGSTSFTLDQDLAATTKFYWRARLVQGTTKSEWSDALSFNSKLQSYNKPGELFDTLSDGTTIGTRVGSTTFIPGEGIQINDQASYVRYQLAQTISNGEFSVEVSGLKPSTGPEGKLKIFSMFDGTGDMLVSKYLMNVQYRGVSGNPDNAIAFKVLFGDNDFKLEPDFGQRSAGVRLLDPNKVYLWKATWNTEFRLQIFEGGLNGNKIYDLGITSPGGSYSPSPQYAYLGSSNNLSEDAGSFPGAKFKNVWIGNHGRPQAVGRTAGAPIVQRKKDR